MFDIDWRKDRNQICLGLLLLCALICLCCLCRHKQVRRKQRMKQLMRHKSMPSQVSSMQTRAIQSSRLGHATLPPSRSASKLARPSIQTQSTMPRLSVVSGRPIAIDMDGVKPLATSTPKNVKNSKMHSQQSVSQTITPVMLAASSLPQVITQNLNMGSSKIDAGVQTEAFPEVATSNMDEKTKESLNKEVVLKLNPQLTPQDIYEEIFKFLDPNDVEKCQLVCKKWNYFVSAKHATLPRGLPMEAVFQKDGAIQNITYRKPLPSDKISKITIVSLSTQVMLKFGHASRYQKIRVRQMKIKILESMELQMLQEFCTFVEAENISVELSPSNALFLFRNPSNVPNIHPPTSLNFSFTNNLTSWSIDLNQVRNFFQNSINLRQISLFFFDLEEESLLNMLEYFYKVFIEAHRSNNFPKKVDFIRVPWNIIQRCKNICDNSGFVQVEIQLSRQVIYNLQHAENFLMTIIFYDEMFTIMFRED